MMRVCDDIDRSYCCSLIYYSNLDLTKNCYLGNRILFVKRLSIGAYYY